jgi:uncharacterized membrane protein YoaK (UPF0700 family)
MAMAGLSSSSPPATSSAPPRTADGGRDSRATGGTLSLAALLAIAGGFLDAFTYIAHGGVFANAQTGNVVLLGVFAAAGDWVGAVRHVLPILAFFVGVGVAEMVGDPPAGRRLERPQRSALVLEIAVLAVVGALPGSFSNTVIILAVAFIAALQSTIFGRIGGWSVNTTMTTGNLRTVAASAYRVLLRQERDASPQAVAFGTICIAFLLGAGLGALLTRWLHNHAAWGVCVLLSAVLLLFEPDEPRPRSLTLRSSSQISEWLNGAGAKRGP